MERQFINTYLIKRVVLTLLQGVFLLSAFQLSAAFENTKYNNVSVQDTVTGSESNTTQVSKRQQQTRSTLPDSGNQLDLNSQQKIKQLYGESGLIRTLAWGDAIIDLTGNKDWNRLNKANQFLNRNVEYARDIALWGKRDYWATPLETLGVGHGDCEDYAIAKYFTLVAGGVPADKLRLMYVHHIEVNEPHMVLIYFEEPTAMPMVLDNYKRRIMPANLRTDLRPIYSFNADGLWLAKAKGLGKKMKNSKGVSAWENLLQRIERKDMQVSSKQ